MKRPAPRVKLKKRTFLLVVVCLAIAAMMAVLPLMGRASVTAQINIQGPPGSGAFGTTVTALPNGNFVVTDLFYNNGSTTSVGAVHLYDGATLTLISTLKGSTSGDHVGSGGITVLTNGNYVVKSPDWNNDAGAVTWCSATTGRNGVVSSSNSLTGIAGDLVGSDNGDDSCVTALTNGNYVVNSPFWNNPSPATTDVGAVTWGNGASGTVGVITAANSLVGSTAFDRVGEVFSGTGGVTALTNGNYVVSSPSWNNPSPATTDVGAVTWGNGMGGTIGVITAANSLIGGRFGDQIGMAEDGHNGVMALNNGNYVVRSPFWDNPSPATTDVGAVTWGNGAGSTVGLVSAANSLVGSTANDLVGVASSGFTGVTALTNGNYVVNSPFWSNPSSGDGLVGAVTWCNGTTGRTGMITAATSLIGGRSVDSVGKAGVTALTNGNYVVSSPNWDNPSPVVSSVGAVTWCDGTTGRTGMVSTANSLVGATFNDQVGANGVTALTNGNYVAISSRWNNPSPMITEVGAVTWGNGTGGTVGPVSPANSLVGSTVSDNIGATIVSANGGGGVMALSNGNYVVSSPGWDNPSPAIVNVGAATWGNGTGGTVGVITAANSLIGGTANDNISSPGVIALTNGSYVVTSSVWDNPALGANNNVGAVTWGSGTGSTVGLVSPANSLVGTAGNSVGATINSVSCVTALTNGNYLVSSPFWNNTSPMIMTAGAVTWGNGAGGTVGVITAANSLIGSTAGDKVGTVPFIYSVKGVTALSNGNYVVASAFWNNPSLPATSAEGAVTWGDGVSGTVGVITSANSVLGTVTDGISSFSYDAFRNRLVVGRAHSNIVSILTLGTGGGNNRFFDFDGDGKADVAVWRPSSGTWFINNSSNGSTTTVVFGTSGDVPVAADYDGDGKMDIAVWRPANGTWYRLNSSNGAFVVVGWGVATDKPVPADYDGDGKTDVAVFRPSNGTWYIQKSADGSLNVVGWGASGDVPVPGDYDNDHKTDVAVWRPSSGTWFINNSSTGSTTTVVWGTTGDVPVAGDYDGDGKTDIAVWRPANGTWYRLDSSNGSVMVVGWGVATDKPVPADYDGDGKTDVAVFRPSNGTWYIQKSADGSLNVVGWGTSGDVPVSGIQ